MAPRQGFRGNRRVIGQILKSDPGMKSAVNAAAGFVAKRSGGTVRTYTTDRHVAAVEVNAEDQAVDGVATKAVNELRGFSSRRQWRRAFASDDPQASDRARATTGGYKSLPEKKSDS